MKFLKLLLIIALSAIHTFLFAQTAMLKGIVTSSGAPIEYATVALPKLNIGTTTDSAGAYTIKKIPMGTHQVRVSCLGYINYTTTITIKSAAIYTLSIPLEENNEQLNEVVVTGTLKEVSRAESPVPVEIITPKLFKKNPTSSLFEAVGMVNGVQPQLNCNVCNTGDIHINGMEGPYTMILIDGMPIVSALSTVYGLSGIPNSLVERIEVVKGPASSLYGSEAMGGIINVITKNPARAPLVSADVFGTNWGEYSVDAAVKFAKNKKTSLLGVNYYNYQNPIDKNGDGFTDVTLQNRISVFNKWNFERKDNREASIAARYVYEDRWGGQTNWNREWRGSDTIYGESIYTNRAEIIGKYQLPTKERIYTQFSYNWHGQNSYYGIVPYMATQQVAFVQSYWDKELAHGHNMLLGASYRYTYYDDNTPGTTSANGQTNQPASTPLPGIFIQDEWTVNKKHKLLAGYRYDYDRHHGNVHSPRLAYKFAPNTLNTLRASFGTGYRVVNLFTEDHAALTGARQVIIAEKLNPERSYNSNLNYETKLKAGKTFVGLDATAFYSYFTNKIVGDFDTDPNKIIYNNLRGYAVSRGVSVNADITFKFPLKLLVGITYMDVYQMNDNGNTLQHKQQLHAPKWSGTFVLSYQLPRNFTVDFTGKWTGPMRLPILPNDYRPEYSPWFCIANIQLTKKFANGVEVYGGVKNIFDFVPLNPIMRPFDPFDKTAADPVNNPNGYTFDPSYNYSSMQGARAFFGLRYNLFRG
jgi:outer membrane receptor for ferrienterochelin and colicins